MDRALEDLAESALGLSREMRWSMSEDITRLEFSRLFARCYAGILPAEQALDIFVDSLMLKTRNNVEVIESRVERLVVRLSNYELRARDGEPAQLPALVELAEFFLGLNDTTDWSTDENIIRKEMYPVFARCAVRKLTSEEALEAIIDQMVARRDHIRSSVQEMVARLKDQLEACVLLPKTVGAKEGEEVTNGDG